MMGHRENKGQPSKRRNTNEEHERKTPRKVLELLNCFIKLTHIGSNLLARVQTTGLKHDLVPPRPERNPRPGHRQRRRVLQEHFAHRRDLAPLEHCEPCQLQHEARESRAQGFACCERGRKVEMELVRGKNIQLLVCSKGTNSWVHSTTY